LNPVESEFVDKCGKGNNRKMGRRAEHNPDRNRPTIQFLFPKQKGGEDEAGEITSINGDVPQIIVQVPEDVEIRDKLG
jgi:hypothetical protein